MYLFWIYRWIFTYKVCQKSKNAILSVKNQCFDTPQWFTWFWQGFQENYSLFLNSCFNIAKVAKIPRKIAQFAIINWITVSAWKISLSSCLNYIFWSRRLCPTTTVFSILLWSVFIRQRGKGCVHCSWFAKLDSFANCGQGIHPLNIVKPVGRERSGSVVECLTRDRGAAGWSVTALWSLSKAHLS